MVLIIIRTPWPISKGLDHLYFHVYVCLLLCFMLALASLVLVFATLDALSGFVVVWLHPTPMRPCLDVTIWDASPWCRLLRAYFPLFHSMQWYACHARLCHSLAFYASLHACSHVNAWVMLASVSSIVQHNEVMDTTFCLPSCLFAFLLVCLLSCFFACHAYYAYSLYAFSYALCIFFLPWLVC